MKNTAVRVTAGLALITFLSAYGQAPPPPAAATPPAAAPQAAPPPAAPAPAPQATVGGFNMNNASLLEVIDTLAKELKLNYVLDASIKGGSVTVNTFGVLRDVDLRPLLETILRMNNLAMVQVGNLYRIIPAGNISRQPISPVTQTDPAKIPDDERLVLNLIFLKYATSSELVKVLTPFVGDGGQISSYDPANLLILLDNSRNMRRSLEIMTLFDSDTFAGQRVRSFEVKNGRPSAIAKDLDEVFKAYSLTGAKDRNSSIQFIPIDRINTVIAVAPTPGVFDQVQTWLAKLDVLPRVVAGSIQNKVYRLKYGRAEVLGGVIAQLYGACVPSGLTSGYGVPGNSSYPAQGYVGVTNSGGGASGYTGTNGGSPYGTNALGYGNSGYGNGQSGTGFGSTYGAGANCGGSYTTPTTAAASTSALSAFSTTPAAPAGNTGSTPASATPRTDQTGSYLAPGTTGILPGGPAPRIIPNPFDNTLLVQSTPEQWEQIKDLLDQLDISPRQVLIDAKIYEVDLEGDWSAGVQAFLQSTGAALPSGIAGRQLVGSNNGAATLLSAGTLVGQSRQLLALLTLNEYRSRSKVLSAPSVIATDSIPASITVGDSVPTLSSQAVNPGVTTGGNSLFTQTISNTSTGIGLNILARVNSSGIVTLVIDQSVTAPEPNPSGASISINSPSFSQRNISTQVTVQDGDTIAIGGIIDENTTETSQGIPFLDRLPYIGALFGTKSSTKSRKELIVFLTPRVIYDTNQIVDATQELKDKVKGLRKVIQQNP